MTNKRMLEYAQQIFTAMKAVRLSYEDLEGIEDFMGDMDDLTNFYMHKMEDTLKHHLGLDENETIQ